MAQIKEDTTTGKTKGGKPVVPADQATVKAMPIAEGSLSGPVPDTHALIDPSEYDKIGYDPYNPLGGLTQAAGQSGKSSQDVMDAANALAQKRQEGEQLDRLVPTDSVGIGSTPLATQTANQPLPPEGGSPQATAPASGSPEQPKTEVAPTTAPAKQDSSVDWSWLPKLGQGAMGVLGNTLRAIADGNSTRADQTEMTSTMRNQAKQLQANQLANEMAKAQLASETQKAMPMLSSKADINTAGGVLPYQLRYLQEAYNQMLGAYGGPMGVLGTSDLYRQNPSGTAASILNGQIAAPQTKPFQIPNSLGEMKSGIVTPPRLK